MKQEIFEVISNTNLAQRIYKIVLKGNTEAIERPGQFVDIKTGNYFLRRPIAVCDYTEDSLTIVFKVFGGGTEWLSEVKPGDKLDLLVGLGNGYDTSLSGDRPLLLGGGAGTPPLYCLCKQLIAEGKKPTVVLGFNTFEDVFFKKEFKELGVILYITTADGSYGTRGFVTTPMPEIDYTYFYCCGPDLMMKTVYDESKTSGQFSFEERMGCGFGACMGCSRKTKSGTKRVCKEGPVFFKEDILW